MTSQLEQLIAQLKIGPGIKDDNNLDLRLIELQTVADTADTSQCFSISRIYRDDDVDRTIGSFQNLFLQKLVH